MSRDIRRSFPPTFQNQLIAYRQRRRFSRTHSFAAIYISLRHKRSYSEQNKNLKQHRRRRRQLLQKVKWTDFLWFGLISIATDGTSIAFCIQTESKAVHSIVGGSWGRETLRHEVGVSTKQSRYLMAADSLIIHNHETPFLRSVRESYSLSTGYSLYEWFVLYFAPCTYGISESIWKR